MSPPPDDGLEMKADPGAGAGRAVGIDLGTTNTLVAWLPASGVPEILPNRDQEALTPSVIGLAPQSGRPERGKYLLGRQALNNARRDSENTIRSIKRFMGLSFNDPKVQVAREHVTYKVLEDPGRSGALVVKVGDTLLTPEEVSAQVLQRVKQDAEARLGGAVTHAVITVPAYFSEPQRVATRRAGVLAGINVKAILDEPTSAAIAEYGDGAMEKGRIMVFDFGGGTLDISILQVRGKDLHVSGYDGDNFLGGDDIDQGLTAPIREWIYAHGGALKATDLRLESALKEEAEKAKKTLAGGADSFAVVIPGACRTEDGGLLDVEMELTQEHLAAVLAPIEKRIRDLLRGFLHQESLQPEFITEVLMVGGTSAIPAFRRLLQEIFEVDGQRRVRLARSPMEAVAKGAALYARMIRGIKCVKCGTENDLDSKSCRQCGESLQAAAFVFDADAGGTVGFPLPRSLGVRYRSGTDSDCYQKILHKGTPYPIPKPKFETFNIPEATRFNVEIYEGEEPRASQNLPLSVLTVDQVPPDLQAGAPVQVGFSYDRDRTLLVTLDFPTSRTNFSPRWRLEQPKALPPEDPVHGLMEFLPRVRNFLSEYRTYMEEGTRLKLQDDLAQAETAITTGDREQAKQLADTMTRSLFYGCGTASVLFLADNEITSGDPVYGPAIREATAKLRAQFAARDPAREATRKSLEELLQQVLSRQLNIPKAEKIGSGPTIVK
jgi:molecular chaperone DnaK